VIALDVELVDFSKGDGLVPVIAQDARDGHVLMLGYANREALLSTQSSGELTFYSRSKGRLWKKGESSGNVLRVVELRLDCDRDSVLARVEPRGPTCHTGSDSCFAHPRPPVDALSALDATIAERAAAVDGASSYTKRLLGDRNLRLKKLGEELAELLVALVDHDRARAAEEAGDVFYHALVALRAEGLSLEDVRQVLAARARKG
jgi:phosphoribosyl-ATP pyrophosphohydrolase/phosphoribosyl-AMP cyclohydrolase